MVEFVEKSILAGYLLWTTSRDIKERTLPLAGLILGGTLVLLDVIVIGGAHDRWPGIVPGILLLLLSMLTDGIGRADGIVLIYVGALSGVPKAYVICGISFLYIFFYSMFLFFLKRNRNQQIPYLPFLLAAYMTTWRL